MTGALAREGPALQSASERIRRLESLVEASKLINSATEPEELVEPILTVARHELGVHSGTVYFVDHPRQELWTEVKAEAGWSTVRFPIGRGLAGAVAQTGQALILEDAFADPRFDPAVDLVSVSRTGAVLCVPVRDRDELLLGILQFLHGEHRSFLDDDLEFLQVISEHVAIAMHNAALIRDRLVKERMETELQLGRVIQARLLPPPPDHWDGVDVAASSVPCYEVGGDYYDFIDLPRGELGLAIGDVSGKGVAAALIMSSAQAALRIAAPNEPDLARLISSLNALLLRTTASEKFVTFFFGRYDRQQRLLRYVNAGHNPPLVRTGGTVRRLDSTGPPLGVLRDARFSGEEHSSGAGVDALPLHGWIQRGGRPGRRGVRHEAVGGARHPLRLLLCAGHSPSPQRDDHPLRGRRAAARRQDARRVPPGGPGLVRRSATPRTFRSGFP